MLETEKYSKLLISTSTPTSTPAYTYYGWYSEAVQCLRICNPTEHPYKNKGIALTSPPYTYWKQGDTLVLVTEITNNAFPTPRQIKNGDIFLGPLDSYYGRSYRRFSEKELKQHIQATSQLFRK
jgi:hypothetical protein